MLVLILIFGLLIRLVGINQSLWLDEGTTALVAKDLTWGNFFGEFLVNDFHPPLYYTVIKLFTSVFGNYSEVLLRLPSVAFGIITIFVSYKIGEKFDKKIGLVSAMFLATAPLHIYYSQEARMYSLAAMFVALSVYLYLEKKYFLFAVALALGFWSEYLVIFIVPVFLIHVLLRRRKELAKAGSYIFFAGVLCLPMVLFLPQQLSVGIAQEGSNWWKILGQTSLKNIFLIPAKFIVGRISFPKPLYQLIIIINALYLGILYFQAAKGIKRYSIAWLWLTVPILAGVFIGFFVPVLSYFRFLFVLPAFYIIAAAGTFSLPKRYVNAAAVLVVIFNLLYSGIYLFNPGFQREDWRSFAEASKNSVVVFPSNSQKEAFGYYSDISRVYDIQDISKNTPEVWLVRYVHDIADPGDYTRLRIEQLGFTKTGELNYNGVVVFKYIYENSN